MELLIIRHAIAVDREEFAESGQSDAERPLTDFGRRRMRKNVRGLRRVGPAPEVIVTSPFVRAADTARIVADAFGVESVETLDALTPEHHPSDLLPWLSQQPRDAVVAVVGHEPHLGTLVTWLVGGIEAPNVELKKGGVCLLDLGDRLEAGTAVMRWLLRPAHLRTIAD
jgi:phosphohistidine phosphatase